jgi:acetolactate synthase regulatory subunit
MPLNKDLREFVALLNSNDVEFVVVGAFALARHGIPRYTGDIDLLIRPSPENAERVLATLREFGFGALALGLEDLSAPGKVIQLGVAPNRIDLLTSISGPEFREVWDTRAAGDLDGLPVFFIGKDALIRNKEATGRLRDLGDAEDLRKRTDPS